MNQAKRWLMFGKVNDTFTRIVVHPTSEHPTIRILALKKDANQPILKVYWGDGQVSRFTADQENVLHTYPVGTNYEIRINRGLTELQVLGSDTYDAANIELISVSSPFDIKLLQNCFREYKRSLTSTQTLQSASFNGIKHLTDGSGEFFRYCKELTSISFNSLEDAIGYGYAGVFCGCSKLNNVSMPMLTSIANGMFAGCTALANVSFPLVAVVHNMGMNATGITSLTNANFPALTRIDNTLNFAYCKSLATVNLPLVTAAGYNSSVADSIDYAKINAQTFSHCTALTSVTMNACLRFGYEAFKDCTSLASVSATALKYVGPCAFSGCSALTEINLPAVQYVCDNAFTGCTNLATVRLNAVQYITGAVFANLGGVEEVGEQVTLDLYEALMTECQEAGDVVWKFHEEYVEYYSGCGNLQDVYMTHLTTNEILNLTTDPGSTDKAFPFGAVPECKFHGSDGIIYGSGLVVLDT